MTYHICDLDGRPTAATLPIATRCKPKYLPFLTVRKDHDGEYRIRGMSHYANGGLELLGRHGEQDDEECLLVKYIES